jgi:hypothetical protein
MLVTCIPMIEWGKQDIVRPPCSKCDGYLMLLSKVVFLQAHKDSATRTQWTAIQFSVPFAFCVWSYMALCASSAFGMSMAETRIPTTAIVAALTCVGAIRMYCFASGSGAGLGGYATRAEFSSDRHLATELVLIIRSFWRILRWLSPRNLLRTARRRLGALNRHVRQSRMPIASPVENV